MHVTGAASFVERRQSPDLVTSRVIYSASRTSCSLGLLGLEQTREVEVGGGHVISLDLESCLLESIHDELLVVKVGAGGLGGSWEHLSDLLEEDVEPCLWCEGDDDAVLGEVAKVSDHLRHLLTWVVDGNIDASDGVVLSGDGFQVGGVEFGIDAQFLGTSCGLVGHGVRDVAGGDLGTHLCQRDGEAANTASAVADGFSGDVVVVHNPVEDLLNGLVVTCADVHLDGVDLIGFGVNLVPSVETLGVEVLADLGLVIRGGCQLHHIGWGCDSAIGVAVGEWSEGGGARKEKEGDCASLLHRDSSS
mmetsp:Transcript_14162/g.39031  ORF Transcript_14162/g.39031 Transcript_14162/m.39031 type:complete len:305 (-) Transcript_14162:67-981(-)